MTALAPALAGLEPGFFSSSYARPGTLLRLAWYPPNEDGGVEEAAGEAASEASEAKLRYGAHTDFDGFTLLQREGDCVESPGLEIETAAVT